MSNKLTRKPRFNILDQIRKIPKYFSEEEKTKRFNAKQSRSYRMKQLQYSDKLRDATQDAKFKENLEKIKPKTFTKKMVFWINFIAMIGAALPYVLAFFNRPYEALIPLSTRMVELILGVSLVYMIRAYFDTKAEHTNLNNSIKGELEDAMSQRIADVLTAAGLVTPKEDKEEPEDILSSGLHINNSGKG